jgi:hypothetical protein
MSVNRTDTGKVHTRNKTGSYIALDSNAILPGMPVKQKVRMSRLMSARKTGNTLSRIDIAGRIS